MQHRAIFLLILFSSVLILGCAKKEVRPQSHKIIIETNPNVELISIVYSMTSFKWLRIPEYASYNYWNDIKEIFANYKTHAVIKSAQNLINHNFAWDAPYALILHYSQPPELRKVEDYSPTLLRRINESGVKKDVKSFINNLRII